MDQEKPRISTWHAEERTRRPNLDLVGTTIFFVGRDFSTPITAESKPGFDVPISNQNTVTSNARGKTNSGYKSDGIGC